MVSTVRGVELSVVIPTYCRGEVLLATLGHLFEQRQSQVEILVIDQTPEHPEAIERQLGELQNNHACRIIKLPEPSITGAMNSGLLEARGEVVLFLDDDVIPSPNLLKAHLENYADEEVWAVVGQILQPGEAENDGPIGAYQGSGLWCDLDFPFNGTRRRQIYNCMAGNLSVRRRRAISVGGMDMQFRGVAYRFETEFARRLTNAGGKVIFDPAAGLHHLRAASGGTRSHGNHLTSSSPAHGVGDYYLAFKTAVGKDRWKYIYQRLVRSVSTKFHIKRPWWIPVKLLGEIRALMWAGRLKLQGPRLIVDDERSSV